MTPEEHFGRRLERIEEKIDNLADALISIARAEEKLVSLEVARSEILQQLTRLRTAVDHNEQENAKLKAQIQTMKARDFTDRAFWIIISAGVSALAVYLITGGMG